MKLNLESVLEMWAEDRFTSLRVGIEKLVNFYVDNYMDN